eukprot:CAMPEP_0115645332 /NCGR_PEP_ID=MMETSP0272-20121206/38347_1 /TAXON_ID=71861 /ORGANISM="Scrippsiella trochoidea, Strain CCMP3099" /LENGTH=270 /DNA_ID=CAMNT_0003082799 /DNA_START=125 /DNA_END=937 /DNA_ORIENTATION=+
MGTGQSAEPRPRVIVQQHHHIPVVFDKQMELHLQQQQLQQQRMQQLQQQQQHFQQQLPQQQLQMQRARSAVLLGSPTTVPLPISGRGTEVLLHVYDLGTSGEGHMLNSVLRVFGTGAFHCGVEVYGKEWSYRGRACAGTGVFATRPRNCECHTYSQSVSMGESPLSAAEVSRLIGILQREWPGTRYDTLRNNCCHFSDKFCRCLGVGSIPSWITNLASAGVALVETGNYLENQRRSLTRGVTDMLNCDGSQTLGSEVIENVVQPAPRWLA